MAKAEYRYRQATTRLSLGVGLQRGHVPPPVAVAWWQRHFTAWFCSMLCRASQWARRGTAMPRHHEAVARVFAAVVARARCGTHFVALRVYIGCCFVKWPPVAALKLRLVSSTASRPGGFTKPTLCKVPPLGTVAQPSALPRSHSRPTRLRPAPLWLLWHLGIGQALRAVFLVSGLRPVMMCVPRPPCGLAAARRWPCAGLPRPPPRGSHSPARVPRIQSQSQALRA